MRCHFLFLRFVSVSPCICLVYQPKEKHQQRHPQFLLTFTQQIIGPKTKTPWASTSIKIMVDPISMMKTLRVQQWWLYENTHCFNGAWNPREQLTHRWIPNSCRSGAVPAPCARDRSSTECTRQPSHGRKVGFNKRCSQGEGD